MIGPDGRECEGLKSIVYPVFTTKLCFHSLLNDTELK